MAADRLRGTTRLAGVIGWPVEHSRSPQMHNAAFEALGMDWAYVALPVRPERLDELRRIIETDRPDLLVVNDIAYATFVEDFHGVTAVIPRNVILLHSFSKGYAATAAA